MSASATTEKFLTRWVEALANVTNAGTAPIDAERIAVMVRLLGRDGFSPEVFSEASLHAVAQDARYFPAYADIRKALLTWWATNRPPSRLPALPGIAVEGMDEMDRHWVGFWHKRRDEMSAHDYQPKRGNIAADLANLASLIQAQAPRAWSQISGNAILEPREPTETEVAYVTGLLRPEHEQRSATVERDAEPPPPFRDVTAKGDHLKRLRGQPVPEPSHETDREEWE